MNSENNTQTFLYTNNKNFLEKYLEKAPISLALIRAIECKELSTESYLRPVLDIGTGEGLFASILFRDQIDVGIDILSDEIKKTSLSEQYLNLIVSNIENVSLKENLFSTVISNSVFEHLDDLNNTLREINRILKKDGVLIFTTYNKSFSKSLFYNNCIKKLGLHRLASNYSKKVDTIFKHKNLLSIKEWEKMLCANGFEIIKYKEFLSKNTMNIFGLFLPFSLPNLACKKLINRWKLFTFKVFTFYIDPIPVLPGAG